MPQSNLISGDGSHHGQDHIGPVLVRLLPLPAGARRVICRARLQAQQASGHGQAEPGPGY